MTDTPVDKSYIDTIEEADAMAATRPNSSAWTGSDKPKALQEATRRIDAMPLKGQRYEDVYIANGAQKDVNNDGLTQVLAFPRVIDGITRDWDFGTSRPIIPDLVKWACLEEAIYILEVGSGGRSKLQEQGVKSFSIGGKLSETFIDGLGGLGLRSIQARRYLKQFVGANIR